MFSTRQSQINNTFGQLVGTAGTPGLAFGLNIGGYGEMDVAFDGLGGRPTLAQVADGNIHHLVATYDVATGLKSIYLDGLLIGQVALSPNTLILETDSTLGFLGSRGGTAEPFNGRLDEFAIYSAALSLAEIQGHYQNVLNGQNYFFVNQTGVPEPSTLSLLTAILAGAIIVGYRRHTLKIPQRQDVG